MTGPPDVDHSASDIEALLARPGSERLREHKYRFSQAVVFGLPVVGLAWFGVRLGGPEAVLWVAAFQAILAGWVMYVGATGMLIESLLRRQITWDGLMSLISVGLYLAGLVGTGLILLGYPGFAPPFHWSVLVLIAWSGGQWWRLSRRVAPRH